MLTWAPALMTVVGAGDAGVAFAAAGAFVGFAAGGAFVGFAGDGAFVGLDFAGGAWVAFGLAGDVWAGLVVTGCVVSDFACTDCALPPASAARAVKVAAILASPAPFASSGRGLGLSALGDAASRSSGFPSPDPAIPLPLCLAPPRDAEPN
ncbi:MAG TPA: hypothetical protein VGL13_15880 [Polyangiaceae bacterium]